MAVELYYPKTQDPVVPMTPAQLRRTPVVMTPYEVETMKRHSFDRGFLTGVIVTSSWMIYVQYRQYKRARDAQMRNQ